MKRTVLLLSISVLATLILGWVNLAEAQQAGKVWRIGLIHIGLDHVPPSFPALREALKELGYEEGKNIVLDWRNLPNEKAALATAKEFVDKKFDLIVPFENQTIRAAKAATTEIPIVFLHANDPVAAFPPPLPLSRFTEQGACRFCGIAGIQDKVRT